MKKKKDSYVELLEQIKKVAYIKTIGGKGGEKFTDHPNIVNQGPITEIRLQHGTVIDNIQVSYGGHPGERHGFTGGNPYEFKLKKGHNITQINARYGNVVDHLQFITEGKNGATDKSMACGGNGGKPITIMPETEGLVLREIQGSKGTRIDSLTFLFGYPFYLDNLKLDMQYVKEALMKTTPLCIDHHTHDNIHDKDEQVVYNNSKTIKRTASFTWHHSSKFMAGLKIAVGAKMLTEAKSEFTVGVESEATVGETHGTEMEHSFSWNDTIICSPNKRTIINAITQEAELENCPYTYDVVFYDGDKTNIIEPKITMTGTFKGKILSSATKIETSEEPLPINK